MRTLIAAMLFALTATAGAKAADWFVFHKTRQAWPAPGACIVGASLDAMFTSPGVLENTLRADGNLKKRKISRTRQAI
jgi:hypothetical protein